MEQMQLDKIKEAIERRRTEAMGILSGDKDNYDGADGARYIRDLCDICKQLISEVEKGGDYDDTFE